MTARRFFVNIFLINISFGVIFQQSKFEIIPANRVTTELNRYGLTTG